MGILGPRSQLARALLGLGVEEDTVHLLRHFHHESRYHCLAATMGSEWIRTGFTFYADDALAQCKITSASDPLTPFCME